MANRSPASASPPTDDLPTRRLADSSTAVVTPDWVKHAVFYQIFPDRFAKSDSQKKPSNLEPWDSDPTPFGYKGGDLAGVRERLDYLQDLGVTALYFNPIFQSASNHRYHTHDYYKIDPLLGGDEAFDALLAECRRRGVRIIAGDDRASVRLGTLLLFTFPGAPSIYYGDEIGLTGTLPDHWTRKTFPWDHPERWDLDTLAFHRRLIALHRSHPALQTGDYAPLYADRDVYAFARTLDGSMLIAAVNVAEDPRRFEIPLAGSLPAQPATPTILFATDGSPTTELTPGALMLTLPARSGAVFDASPAPDDHA